jgi:hypothetical protein
MKNTKKVTIATLCSILLLGSMSAAVQAASSQSINSITLKTVAAKAPTDAEKKKMIDAEKGKDSTDQKKSWRCLSRVCQR